MISARSSKLVSGSSFGQGRPTNNASSSAVSSSNKSARDIATSGYPILGAHLFDRFTYAFIPSHHPVVPASDGKGAPALAKAIPQPGRALLDFSQRSVGPCRGGSRPDHCDPDQVIGQGVPRPSLWRRLRALCVKVEAIFDRIEESWVGDLLGVVGLAALVVAMSFIVGMLNAGAF